MIRTIGEYTMSALLYGVFNRPISISMVTNMQEYKVGISLAYGVIVIAICYVALAVIFKLDKKRFYKRVKRTYCLRSLCGCAILKIQKGKP